MGKFLGNLRFDLGDFSVRHCVLSAIDHQPLVVNCASHHFPAPVADEVAVDIRGEHLERSNIRVVVHGDLASPGVWLSFVTVDELATDLEVAQFERIPPSELEVCCSIRVSSVLLSYTFSAE